MSETAASERPGLNKSDQKSGSGSAVLELLYMANMNGYIENCKCGKDPRGGLARIYEILAEKRKTNPDVLFIDGGDFLNTYPFPLLNETILKIYNILDPDIITPGDQEFIGNASFIEQIDKQFAAKVIATNIQWKNAFTGSDFLLFERNGRKFVIFSYLDAAAFEFIDKSIHLKFNNHRFESVYERFKDEAFLILLFHGRMTSLQQLANEFPEIDCILHAHQQSRMQKIENKPYIIGGGADGEYLINIKLNDENDDSKVSAAFLSVDLNIKPNLRIISIVKKFNEQNKREIRNEQKKQRRQ